MNKIKIGALIPNGNNPRNIKPEMLDKLKKSIKDFEKMMELRPIVVNASMKILGGNMRYHALKELGYTEIPESWVKVAKGITPEQEREFIIKDNVGFGEWDWDILANEWDEMELEEWGVNLPNFDDVPPILGTGDSLNSGNYGDKSSSTHVPIAIKKIGGLITVETADRIVEMLIGKGCVEDEDNGDTIEEWLLEALEVLHT